MNVPYRVHLHTEELDEHSETVGIVGLVDFDGTPYDQLSKKGQI